MLSSHSLKRYSLCETILHLASSSTLENHISILRQLKRILMSASPNARALFELIKSDFDFQSELAENPSPESMTTKIAAYGEAHDLPISIEEIRKVLTSAKAELSDRELEEVVGGKTYTEHSLAIVGGALISYDSVLSPSDSLTGRDQDDIMFGLTGDDAMEGKGGDDYMDGGWGMTPWMAGRGKTL